MSDAVVDALFQRVFESSHLGKHLTVSWHAGEPLTLPKSFYEDALVRCRRHNTRHVDVTFNVQTNATLVDLEWAQFLKRHGFSIGVSIDGPAFIHDAHRQYRSGKGSFEAVIRGISHLRAVGLAFDVIAVVTRRTLDHADEFVDFFAQLGARSVGFNIEEQEGVHRSPSVQATEIASALPSFLDRLMERYVKGLPYGVREYDGLFRVLNAETSRPLRQQTATPMRIINVDVLGNISTFSPELLSHHTHLGPIRFGNVFDNRLDDLVTHPTYLAVSKEIEEGIENCRSSCEYFPLCGGGSPSNKYFENGAFCSTNTNYCEANIKAVVDSFLKRMV